MSSFSNLYFTFTHSKAVWLSLFCKTQKNMFSRMFMLLFSVQGKWTVIGSCFVVFAIKEIVGKELHKVATFVVQLWSR